MTFKYKSADINHPFVKALSTILYDEQCKEKAKRISRFVNSLRHYQAGNPDVPLHVPPTDIAFAIKIPQCPIDRNQCLRITRGLYMPTLGEIQQIAINHGMPPDEPRTRAFVEMGKDFILQNSVSLSTGKDIPVEMQDKFKKEIPSVPSDYTTSLGQLLKALRTSRLRFSNGKIIHKEEKYSRYEKPTEVTLEMVRLGIDIPNMKLGPMERDEISINKQHLYSIELVMEYLHASDEERVAIQSAFKRVETPIIRR